MSEYAYMLRTCAADMTARYGFRWPKRGRVVAPDWRPDAKCGGGLHGLLWGEGHGHLLDWSISAKWLVVRVRLADVVDLDGKVKVPEGYVVHCGDQKSATDWIVAHGAAGRAVVGVSLAGGDGATLVGGDRATLTGGDYATLVGGDCATLTGGDRATLTGGPLSTLTGGDYATLTGGYRATLVGGDRATLTGGDCATLTGGDRATLTGGPLSTLTGGNHATLTGGYHATLTGGDCATLIGGYRATLTGGYGATLVGGPLSALAWRVWDGARRRVCVRYVGEDGICPDVAYRWVDGQVVEATHGR